MKRRPRGGSGGSARETSRWWSCRAAALAGALSGGCTATISMTDGRVIEGRLQGSDARTLVVSPTSCADATGAQPADCRTETMRLHRVDVEAIDHPGAPQIGIGIGLLGAGPLAYSFGFLLYEPGEFVQPFALAGLASSVVGTVVLTLGIWTWARSDAAAQLPWE